MPRGGARPGAGRKPGSKSLIRAGLKQKHRERPNVHIEGEIDSLAAMRACLALIYNEVPDALKKVRDLCGEGDPKVLLEAIRSLRLAILDTHTIAKDIAPFEHRRLAGEKPLDQDKAAGPPVLTLTAIEQAC